VFYDHDGWLGVVGYVTVLLLGAIGLGLLLRRIPRPSRCPRRPDRLSAS